MSASASSARDHPPFDSAARASRRSSSCSSVKANCIRLLPAPREAEHPLGDDVAKDLGGARLDRVAARAQLLVLPVAVVLALENLHRDLRQALVVLRPVQLRSRALRAVNAGLKDRRQ